jgi:chemotaxis protein MotB
MIRFGWGFLPVLAALALTPVTVGCGHTDEEMAQKQREIDKLSADLKASRELHEQDQKKFNEAQRQLDELRGRAKDAGLSFEKSEQENAKLRQAMSEYEARLKQLDDMKQRLKDLKSRLDKLTSVGLKVGVRNNRMVIQLPGDILFDSGKDTLKGEGKKILKQVADVIKGDSTLSTRNFQVAGHTDNAPYNGAFQDNWGLSLARSRQVLLFLVAPDKPGKGDVPSGGNLESVHWAASGYADLDPVSGTVQQQTNEDKAKNRRVELVLQPNVEEMLNLKDFSN